MTSPIFRGTSQETAGGTSPAAITGQQVGDTIIGIALSNAGAFTAVPGWTSMASSPYTDGNTGNNQYFAWRKVDGTSADTFNPAGGGSSGLYTFSFAGDIDGTEVSTYWAASAATVFPPNITPAAADDTLVVVYVDAGAGATVTTAPAGYTAPFANNVAGGGRVAAYYKDLVGQNGVAQGPVNLVWSANPWGPAIAILVKAPGAGGGDTLMGQACL